MTTTRPSPTSTTTAPAVKAESAVEKRFGLSWTQIAAAGAASITATVILSFFSISGTLIGAAVFSMASAIGNAVYGQSLRKTQDRVLDVLPVGKSDPASPTVVLPVTGVGEEATGPDEEPRLPTPGPASLSRRAWRRVAVTAVVLFAFVMAVVTSVELLAGRPLTDVLRGEKGTGTSIGGGGRAPAPTVTVTVTPSVVVTTPTVTQTAPAATVTPSPTPTTGTPATTAPASSATPSATSSETPTSGSATSSGSPTP